MTNSNPQCSFGAEPKYPMFGHDCPHPPTPTELCLLLLRLSLRIAHTNARCLSGLSHRPSNRKDTVVLTCPRTFIPSFTFGYATALVWYGFLLPQHWHFLFLGLFHERMQINESEAVNLNEAKCTLLYVMNSQLTRAEVIQSSQLMFSVQDLFKMSHKKSSRITEYTNCDREKFLASYAECYKIFWLSILALCAIFFGISRKEEINYPRSKGIEMKTSEFGKSLVTNQSCCFFSFLNCLNKFRVEMIRESQLRFQTGSCCRHILHADCPKIRLKMLKW